MYVNSSYEYDNLKKINEEGRNASASYKFFSAEYNDSKNSQEFQKKVRDRLVKENFNMQESDARASYKRFLSNDQLQKWAVCVQEISRGGAVFLEADSVSNSDFPLMVKWFPQKGVGSGMLAIQIDNGTIIDKGAKSEKKNINVRMEGSSDRIFIIKPDKTNNQVLITAMIAGSANSLTLPRTYPTIKNPPTPRTTIIVRATEFLRPVNVALQGPPNMNYGVDVLLNAPPYNCVRNAADFEFSAVAGSYKLKIEYASVEARPVILSLNNEIAIPNAMNAPTGGYDITFQRELNQGTVNLKNGINVLHIERNCYFPHIRTFIFEPII